MADLLYKPADIEDLQNFVRQCDQRPLVQGGIANTIVRDGGVRQPVILLRKGFADVTVDGDVISAGAGALNGTVAAAAVKSGIGGLEFYSGIPGTTGGALTMNAGSYGTETKDVLIDVQALDADGRLVTLTPADLHMRYRKTAPPEGTIFLSARFQGRPEDPETVKARIDEIKTRRQDSQPIREKTGGSTFANPSAEDLAAAGLPKGTKTWQLIDQAGGRGYQIGGAKMSEKHCNFMINTGEAKAADLEALGEEMIRRVYEQTGVKLRWEIRRVGEKL